MLILLLQVFCITAVNINTFCSDFQVFYNSLNANTAYSASKCTDIYSDNFVALYNSTDYTVSLSNLDISGVIDFYKIPMVDQMTNILLNSNKITGIVNMTLAVNLKSLDAADNIFSVLPTLSSSLISAVFNVPGVNTNLINTTYIPSLPPGITRFWIRYIGVSAPLPYLPLSLKDIDIEFNHLSGQIPDLSLYSSLNNFHAYGNSLTGTIPALPLSLLSIRISSNSIHGSIPAIPPNMINFIANGNQFSGNLPVFPNTMEMIMLNNNKLTGNVNLTLPNLQVLWISGNSFSGVLTVSSLKLGSSPAGYLGLAASNNFFINAFIVSTSTFFSTTNCTLDLNLFSLNDVADLNVRKCKFQLRTDGLPTIASTVYSSTSILSSSISSENNLESISTTNYHFEPSTTELVEESIDSSIPVAPNSETVVLSSIPIASISETVLLSSIPIASISETVLLSSIPIASISETLLLTSLSTDLRTLASSTSTDVGKTSCTPLQNTSSCGDVYEYMAADPDPISSVEFTHKIPSVIGTQNKSVLRRAPSSVLSSYSESVLYVTYSTFKQFSFNASATSTTLNSHDFENAVAHGPADKTLINPNLSERFAVIADEGFDASIIMGLIIGGLAIIVYILCLIFKNKPTIRQFSILLISFLLSGIFIACCGLVFNTRGFFWIRNICKESGMWMSTLSFIAYYLRIFFIIERPINGSLLTRFSNMKITWWISVLCVLFPTLIITLVSLLIYTNPYVTITFGCIRILVVLRFSMSVFLEESKLLPLKPSVLLLVFSCVDLFFTLPLEVTSEAIYGLLSMSCLLLYLLIVFSMVGWNKNVTGLQPTKIVSYLQTLSKNINPIFTRTRTEKRENESVASKQ
eukprot:NODE_349_length_10402_cov_0.251286.p1 type:complete len:863 gc:universal NODE_349_length_10402_cov_0.251286:7624-5036(-)